MACGPNRAPARCDVPPSNGAPTTTTSASPNVLGVPRSHRSTPRNVMSGPYIAPYPVIADAPPRSSRRPLVDAPRRAVVAQHVEERHRVERLRAENSGAAPDAGLDQLQCDHRVDSGLPDDRLRAVL